MTTRQEVKLKRNNVVISVLNSYQSDAATIPALARKITEFVGTTRQIEQIHLQQASDTKGITEGKNLLKDDVAELGLVIAGALFSYGDSINNADLCERMDLVITDFKKNTVANFKKLCTEIVTEAQKAGTNLVDFGTTAETVTTFQTLVTQFHDLATKPREEIVKKSTATTTLDELFTISDQILEFHIDKLMLQFKSRNSQFYKDYQNARIIEDRGSRTLQATPPPPVNTQAVN
jgi:hypothetical protein